MNNSVNHDNGDSKPLATLRQEKSDLLATLRNAGLDLAQLWERIQEAFKSQNPAEIAQKLGIERQSVYKWRDKKNPPELNRLIEISAVTKSSLHWLLTGEGPKSRDGLIKTLSQNSDLDYSSAVPVYLEEHLEEKLTSLAAKEERDVSDMAAQLIIEAMMARGLVTDKVEGIQLQFFGDVEIKLIPIPLLGTIAAGKPLHTFDTPDTVLVAEEFIIPNRKTYALRVQGDSMIDEGILDGDLLIIVETQEAHPGQTVVALVDGDQATVKKFYRRGNQIVLRPANPIHKDITLSPDRVQIQGVVVGIQRRT